MTIDATVARNGHHGGGPVALQEELTAPGPDDGVVLDPGAERRARLGLIDSAEFDRARYRHEWLVERVLVAGQPAVLGGPRKSLKTSLLVELAVSLGAPEGAPPGRGIVRPTRGGLGRGFLGKFAVPRPTRVGFFSGESGGATLQETARRVCRAKGVELASLGVSWGTELPRLADPGDLAVLGRMIGDHGLGVVIIDPAYLALLAGARDVQATNLFQMGPLLADFARACLEAGATPILAHHSVKHREQAMRNEPMELEELAFAGAQEFSRQWCLISRRARYEPGTGSHKLWLNVGGSAGFSGLWAVDIEEGVVDDGFGGRSWKASVSSPDELREAEQARKETKKRDEQDRKSREAREAIVQYLRGCPGRADSLTGIAVAAGVHKAPRAWPIVASMVADGALSAVSGFRKGNRTCAGYRLARADEDDA